MMRRLVASDVVLLPTELVLACCFEAEVGVDLSIQRVSGRIEELGNYASVEEAMEAVEKLGGPVSKDPLAKWRDPKYTLLSCRQRSSKQHVILAAHGAKYLETGLTFDTEKEAKDAINYSTLQPA